MVLQVLIAQETVLEAKNVPILNKTHVHIGLDGVPGQLQHPHATQQKDARPVHAMVVTQITVKDQLNAVKMSLCQTNHAHNLQLNCPLNSAAHGQTHSVASNRHGKNVVHVHQSTKEIF